MEKLNAQESIGCVFNSLRNLRASPPEHFSFRPILVVSHLNVVRFEEIASAVLCYSSLTGPICIRPPVKPKSRFAAGFTRNIDLMSNPWMPLYFSWQMLKSSIWLLDALHQMNSRL